jgi:virginiamycin B lyase
VLKRATSRTTWRRPMFGLLVPVLGLSLLGCGAASSTSDPALSPVAPSPSSAAAPSSSSSPHPAETPSPSFVASEDIDAAGATRLTLDPSGDWISMAGGDAWVAVGAAVVRLNGADGSQVANLAIPGETCLAMDVAFDAVWAGACRSGSPSIVRIDPITNSIAATIPLDVSDLQYESSVAAGEGAVWALSVDPVQVLIKVDPASDKVVATYPMPGGQGGIRAGYGALWSAQTGTNKVLRVDPATGSITDEIPVGHGPRFLAVGLDAVWVMNANSGTVSRIDPASAAVTATIAVSPQRIDGGDIAVGGGYVWARVSDDLVSQIDPAINEVVVRYGPSSGSGSVAADAEAVWISAHDVNAVWRLPLR